MKGQNHKGKAKEPKAFPLDQLRKESGQEHEEEYAAELSAPYAAPRQAPVEVRDAQVHRAEEANVETKAKAETAAWPGYTALALGVLSLFLYPVLFGGCAVLLGIIAYSQGQRALGGWSAILGLVSLAGYFLLVPMYS